MIALWREDRAARWLSASGAPWPRGKAWGAFQRMRAHWACHGFGPYIWREKGRFAGYGGLKYAQLGGRARLEALWGFTADFEGVGYASEAMRAALQEPLGFDRVHAVILPQNARSIALAERLGFKPIDEIDHAGLRHLLFEKIL